MYVVQGISHFKSGKFTHWSKSKFIYPTNDLNNIDTRSSNEPVIAHLTQSCFGKVWPWWQIPKGSNIKL